MKLHVICVIYVLHVPHVDEMNVFVHLTTGLLDNTTCRYGTCTTVSMYVCMMYVCVRSTTVHVHVVVYV